MRWGLLFAATAVGAVNFTNTITLGGLIIMGLVGITGLAVLGYGAKWKSVATVTGVQADELRKAFEDEKSRAERLYDRLTDMVAERNELTLRIARLEERPNLDKLVEILQLQSTEAEHRTTSAVEALMEKIDERFEASDKRHEQRHQEVGATLTRAAEALERFAPKEAPA